MAVASAEGLPKNHTRLCQASAEHFQQCAEFPLLRNRGLGPLAVTVLAIRQLVVTPPARIRPGSQKVFPDPAGELSSYRHGR